VKAGWEVRPLGGIADNLDSKRVPITKAKRIAGNVPYYGASGIVDQVRDYLFDEELLLISEDGANLLARTYPIAFSVAGKTWVNNHAHVLKFSSIVTQRFVELFLNSISLEPYVSGMAQPKLNQKRLSGIPIPLPPLEEQQRIVAVLDEAFEGLARARAHATANLQNARELFESGLKGVFGGEHPHWTTSKLTAVTSKIGSGATPKGGAAAYKAEGISLIRSLNVHDRDFRLNKLAYIDDDQATKLSNVEVLEGDVLLNITGASVARCCQVPTSVLPARVNQHVSILRPDQNILLPAFLCYELTSENFKELLLRTGEEGGATRQAITKAQLQDLSVTFPPSLNEQFELVERLDAAEQEVKALQANYQTKLQDLDDLRQSLLQKAFAGELT
jgi:type I restriction enzyme, S subunit